MEEIYILGKNKSLGDELGGTFIEIPKLNSEIDVHDWIIGVINKKEIDKIIIEIESDPILAFQIGYHIRLSINTLKKQALTPIMFLSKLSLNTILLQSEIYSQILVTKGVSFAEHNLQAVKEEIKHLQGLHANDYLVKFLKLINIQPDETIGRHSLANIWGAYAMDKASNANALSHDANFKKGLHFKYISAFNNLDMLNASNSREIKRIPIGKVDGIDAIGKRILLIDDEASKGWESVLRKIFKTESEDDFTVIDEKVKDFDSFSKESKNIIETESFDLYLLDLRLNGLEEDENTKTEYFSGMNVLHKIKSQNQGNQVIVFTASNKAWNLKALLDAGANGYYLKESPEYNFSRFISEQNYKDFKENVKITFAKGYLREIYIAWEQAEAEKSNSDSDFISESNIALDIAWEQINKGYLDFGYLTLYQSIESYANNLYKIDTYNDTLNGKVTIDKTDEAEHEWLMKYNEGYQNGSYFSSDKLIQKSSIKPTTLYKVSCLFKIKYEKDDTFLMRIGKLNKLRNNIAHNGAKDFTSKKDLIEILRILGEIRNN